MKILVNGNTMKELIFAKKDNNEIAMTREDIVYFDRVVGHLKKNKGMYMKLVVLLAVTTSSATLSAWAAGGNIDIKLKTMSDSIIHVLVLVAKYGSMGMGLKTMVVSMLNGGNLKDATMSGLHYWLSYVFFQFYPYLYELVEGLQF